MRRTNFFIVSAGLVIAWVGLRAAIDLAGAPTRGNANAPLTLVEFSDYQCPSCGFYIAQVYPKINRLYVKTGKIKYVVKNFPIDEVHPQAFKAHEAAACAGDSSRFWEMHDKLFANQHALAVEQLSDYAQAVGVDRTMFQVCLDSGRKAAGIRKDQQEGMRVGIRGTPTIVLGMNTPGSNEMSALRVIVGAHPYEEYRAAIEALLTGR